MGPTMNEAIIMSMYVLLISVICYIIYWYGYGRFQLFKQLGIPGPAPSLFVGNAIQISKDYPNKAFMFIHENLNKYGGLFGYYARGKPVYVTSDPEILKEIMAKRFSNFTDRQKYNEWPYPLSLMVIRAMGEEWKFLRRTLAHSFTTGKIRQLSSIFNNSTDTCINLLHEMHKAGKGFDITRIYGGFSMESIIAASFGIESKSQTTVNSTMVSLVKEFVMPHPKWFITVQMFPLSEHFIQYVPNRVATAGKLLLGHVIPIIRKRREQKSEQSDMLQLMLDTQQKINSSRKMTEDEISASCCAFVAAGYETTSTTLSTLAYELAMHADYQETLYKEICNIWTDTTILPDYDVVKKMKYMDQVINETLRFYPPVPTGIRRCKNDCTINGIKFCADTNVIIPIYSLHRDPKVWEKPNEFYPDHFSQESTSRRNDAMFMPFGYGPRNCIGTNFALLEIKIALIRMIKEYKFLKTTGTPDYLEIFHGFTGYPKGEIILKVEKR